MAPHALIPTAVELSGIVASGVLPLPARNEWGEGNPNKNGPPLQQPSLFSPQIQGYRRFGFLSICGSPESVGKPAFRGSRREDLLGGNSLPAPLERSAGKCRARGIEKARHF